MIGALNTFKGLVVPESFTVSSSTQSIQIDHPYQILYTVLPTNTTNPTVIWESSDTSIATVDSAGLITPVSVGECTITGHLPSNRLTQIINVTTYVVHTTGVSLDKDSIMVLPNTPVQLTATVTPSNTNFPEITWTSSDTNVATVSSTGLVSYVAQGNCTITVTTVDGGCTDTCDVESGIAVESVTLDTHSSVLYNGDTLQLTATVLPADASNKNVIWTSSDDNIATVDDNGLVSFIGDGDCTITVTTVQGGLTDTCEITCTTFTPVDTKFGYTGTVQTITLQPHTYCLEVWGASGGVGSGGGESMRGKGGYSSGCLNITSNTTLYIYIGECGAQDQVWKFNGGAPGQERGSGQCASGGGGTDISLCGGAWDSTNHWYSRIIVAGGGGATGEAPSSQCGGHGGGCSGTVGGSNHVAGGPGTQTSAGGNYYNCSNYRVVCAASFGKGGTAYDTCHNGYDANGGGGGWYGGGGGGDDGGGGGGSGYVFTSDTAGNYPSGRIPTSEYYLTNAYSCVGNTSFPSPSGGTETGHSGYGCARIRSI